MKSIAVAVVVAALALGSGAAGAAVKPANDVSVRMKLYDTKTFAPLAKITVKNEGTSPQSGVVVNVHAENESGPVLWTATVDLLPKKSAKLAARVLFDDGPFVLVATATLAGAADEDPDDNAARGGLWLKGKGATTLVGRELYASNCESCHGAGAAGGIGPSLVAAKAKAILAKTLAGGDHDFPWMSKTDAKYLSYYLKDPAAFVPPGVPAPPVGGWPGFAEDMKPLFDARCVACHPGFGIYERAAAKAGSALTQVRRGSMPKGGANFTAEQIQLVADWITGGRRQ